MARRNSRTTRLGLWLGIGLILGLMTRAESPPETPALPGSTVVRLEGRAFHDAAGPFLGLGASYFLALRDCRLDRPRLESNLALLAGRGFNYIRILGMVSWDGLEIAPVTFTNRTGRVVPACPDYGERLRDLLDAAGRHGLRVEITLFADAQYVMPTRAAREAHLDTLLKELAGRESQVMHLEVANEAWQNGFPGGPGIAELRDFTRRLAERTPLLVAITSSEDISDAGIQRLYRESAADLATVHLSRDTRTPLGPWLPVIDAYRVGHLPGVPPVTSNEPIGPGSSVASESDPLRLCSAAIVAYLAGLPGYVFHARTGIYGYADCCPPGGGALRFETTPGIDAFRHLHRLLPPDLPNWDRNDAREPAAPFQVFCDGQPDRYWRETKGATDGCVRTYSAVKGDRFLAYPMGILAGGLTLQARRDMQFEVLDPLTGVGSTNLTLTAGQRFTLPQGPGAHLLRGTLR